MRENLKNGNKGKNILNKKIMPFVDAVNHKISLTAMEHMQRLVLMAQRQQIKNHFTNSAILFQGQNLNWLMHNHFVLLQDSAIHQEEHGIMLKIQIIQDAKDIAIKTASNCPSGRLVVHDKKTKKPYEKNFEPSIDLIEDPQAEVSGGIWLKGGIELESADGSKYETRNRMTLCRCGKSNNKPFCDGLHLNIKFNDGDESLKK